MKIQGTFKFFGKIFGSESQRPPKKITQRLLSQFPLARGIEWNTQGNFYEAIFFDKDTEMIARFDPEGTLNELRINVAPASLPQFIRNNISPEFEIMNCIEVHTNQSIYYELIIRDQSLQRFLLMADNTGSIIRKEPL